MNNNEHWVLLPQTKNQAYNGFLTYAYFPNSDNPHIYTLCHWDINTKNWQCVEMWNANINEIILYAGNLDNPEYMDVSNFLLVLSAIQSWK